MVKNIHYYHFPLVGLFIYNQQEEKITTAKNVQCCGSVNIQAGGSGSDPLKKMKKTKPAKKPDLSRFDNLFYLCCKSGLIDRLRLFERRKKRVKKTGSDQKKRFRIHKKPFQLHYFFCSLFVAD